MRKHKLLNGLTSCAIALACAWGGLQPAHSQGAPGGTVFLPMVSQPSQALYALARNAQLWRDAGIKNYSYVYRLSCFCAPGYTRPLSVTVVNGAISTVLDAQTGLTTTVAPKTIEQMFDNAARAVSGAYTYTLNYDGVYGFPTNIAVDWVQNMADEETSEVITAFVPSPGNP